MRCVHCGRALEADARFCEGCGQAVATPAPAARSPLSGPPPGPPPAPFAAPAPAPAPFAPPAPPAPARGRSWTGPILALGCGCLVILLVLGGLGLWWWKSSSGGIELPTFGGSPTPTPVASAPAAPDTPAPADTPVTPNTIETPEATETPDAAPSAVSSPSPDAVEWGPSTEAATVLFEDRGDVDGDGQDEAVQVVAEDGNGDPTASAPRNLRVVKSDGRVAFETQTFKEPFRPDLDHLADSKKNRAGIHVVATAGTWPDLRLVFAPASGNYVVFRYDGSTYQVVDSGN